ncbi:MAG: ADP-glyceromanno-heptose 6-epimerase [Bacteroidota bacterium]
MIIITGAEGFIGSCLVAKLNEDGFNDLILVDDFSDGERSKNITEKKYTAKIERKEFFDWLDKNEHLVEFIFHIGARTDTTESDEKIFKELNLDFSKTLWNACVKYGLPLVYASSAATYGDGEFGYDDDTKLLDQLQPMNPYGRSKNDFDKWAVVQKDVPFFWAGLKFFNVYGPNEYHKGRMASVVLHAFNQIKETGKVKLFRSHKPDFNDGEQMRDFIYVKDLCDVCVFLMTNRKHSGIYNLGSGKARTFKDLVKGIFVALNITPQIEFIDTPEDIREKYQYFTEAKMEKLKNIGYTKPFTSVEDGVIDYVKNYLQLNNRW